MSDNPSRPMVKIMARYGNETVCVGRAPLPGPYDPPLMIRDSEGTVRIVEDPRGVRIIEEDQ